MSVCGASDLREGLDLEFKAASGRDGRGELPGSLWESYSAMANTAGGLIILGVKEHSDQTLSIIGVPDSDRIIREFWSLINNPSKVNINLLQDEDVQRVTIPCNGGSANLVIINVPRAQRKDAPVYLNGNPFGGTYRRMNEGDFKCPQRVVERLLADRQYDTFDAKIFDKYGIGDVDSQSLSAYRNMFNVRNAAHPFATLSDSDFLEQLGGISRDRRTGVKGLTLAGLLMFGKLRSILDNVGTYVVDYREYGPKGSNERWTDRLTTDFAWSGNLFDFCRRTLLKLYADLKVPFALNPDGTRKDETPAHVALREALVNTLIHADYGGSSPIVIAKTPNCYQFVNPGLPRLPQNRVFQGGIANSDCRNRTMQKMFELIGYAEQAGSGFPKILAGCDYMGVEKPTMTEDLELFQTRTTIRRPSPIEHGAIEQMRNGNRKERIVMLMRENPTVTLSAILSAIGGGKRTVEREVAALQKEGRVIREGGRKTGQWKIVS